MNPILNPCYINTYANGVKLHTLFCKLFLQVTVHPVNRYKSADITLKHPCQGTAPSSVDELLLICFLKDGHLTCLQDFAFGTWYIYQIVL